LNPLLDLNGRAQSNTKSITGSMGKAHIKKMRKIRKEREILTMIKRFLN